MQDREFDPAFEVEPLLFQGFTRTAEAVRSTAFASLVEGREIAIPAIWLYQYSVIIIRSKSDSEPHGFLPASRRAVPTAYAASTLADVESLAIRISAVSLVPLRRPPKIGQAVHHKSIELVLQRIRRQVAEIVNEALPPKVQGRIA